MPTWHQKITAAKDEESHWRDTAKKAVTQYREAAKGEGFNILYPNTQIKCSAVFGRVPEPVVKRRAAQSDSISRQASLMLERGLQYQWDRMPAKAILDQVVLDWMLPGRGVAVVRYEPKTIERFEPAYIDEDQRKFFTIGNEEIDLDDLVETDAGVGRMRNEILSEMVPIDYVPWDCFVHDPQKRWADVRWIAIKIEMTFKEAKESFGKKTAMMMATARLESGEYQPDLHGKVEDVYPIWQIWDKEKSKVHYMPCDGMGKNARRDVLESLDDPYGLEGFFPTPEPLRAVQNPGSLIPITEYSLYETQAQELNIATSRLMRTIKQVQPRGFYDAQLGQELPSLLRGDAQVLKGLENYSQYLDRGGLDSAISWMPIEQFAKVAVVLREHRNDLLNTIYQITGLSDIIRGYSDPRETATAQQLKSQHGGLRLKPAQSMLEHYLRSLMEIQVELMAEKFELPTLAAQAQMQARPEMELLLRSDVRRNFQIDIETDSTIAMDDAVRKQEMTEFLTALGGFIGQATQLQQAGLDNQGVMKFIRFAMGPYRISRDIEEEIERLAAQPRQQGPSLEDQAKMMEAQLKVAKLQQEGQKMQGDMALKVRDQQIESVKNERDYEIAREQLFLDALEVGVRA